MAKPKHPNKPSSKKKPKNPPHPPRSTQPAPSSAPTTPAPNTGSQPTSPSKKQQPIQPQFISIADAAKRLGVSEKTIRRWIDRRKLPAVRMGSQLRIPIGAFLHFIGGLPPARP
jgi:excisionase family DNA binding protein